MGLLSNLREKRLAKLLMRKKASRSCTTVTSAAHPTSEDSACHGQGAPFNPRSSIRVACTEESSSRRATSFPIVFYVPGEKPDVPPQPAYFSLSSDLRILSVRTSQDPPCSLLDFRNPTHHFKLSRMAYEGGDECSASKTLEEYVADRVAPVSLQSGPAIRISEDGRSIQIVARNEEERNHWLSALCLRLAPRCVVRDRLKAEIRSAMSLSTSRISVAEAAREVIELDDENMQQNSTEREGKSVCSPPLAQRLWKTLDTTAQSLNWTSSFGQAMAGSADTVEKLAKPFCQIGVVGSAFSLISLSARTVHLLATEREGRHKLKIAREDLKQASVSICEWIVEILETGFQDEVLIGKVFDAIEKCWDVAADVEQFVVRNWAVRVWNAEEVEVIARKVDVIKEQLLGVGVLKRVAKLEEDVGNVKEDLEKMKILSGPMDNFRSSFPDPAQFSAGLMPEASAVALTQLKSRIIRWLPSESGAENSNIGDKVVRVALTSVSGEGGVGKTSTCKLLCADSDVRNHFSGGAILWITLGRDVSDLQVIERISNILTECGGCKTAEKVDNCESVEKAVTLARQFFSSHRIVLVLDNVWKPAAGSKVRNWFSALSGIAKCRGSVVLMTTRFRDLSSVAGADRVHLGRLNLDDAEHWEIAEALYDQQLAMEPNNNPHIVDVGEYKRTRAQALQLSCGLPLAIATFCGLIRMRGSGAMAILALIERKSGDGGLASRSFGRESASLVGHDGLHAAMSETLQFLDKSEGKEQLFKMRNPEGRDQHFSSNYSQFENHPVSSRYAAMEAMDNSSQIFSFTVLARLWHMKCDDDAEDLCRMFANIGLGRIERHGLALHDLQYDFCVARSSSDSVNGHDLLLSGCMPLFRQFGKEWVAFCFPSERENGRGSRSATVPEVLSSHMSQNLFRHMSSITSGDDGDENSAINGMIRLLTDFRWLRARGFSHGRGGIVSDFMTTLSCFPTGQDHLGEVHQSIRLIKRVVELTPESSYRTLPTESMGDTSALISEGELASHVVGRLEQALIDGWGPTFDVKIVQGLIKSVEGTVRKAWIRPGYGFFGKFSDDTRLVMAASVGAPVTCVADFGDGAHFVSGSSDGIVRIHDIRTGATVLSFGSDESNSQGVLFVAVRETLITGSYLVFHTNFDKVLVHSVSKGDSGQLGVVESGIVGMVASQSRDCFFGPKKSYRVGAISISYRHMAQGDDRNFVKAISVSRYGTEVVAGDVLGTIYVWTHCSGHTSVTYNMAVSFCPRYEGYKFGEASAAAVSHSCDLALFSHNAEERCPPRLSLPRTGFVDRVDDDPEGNLCQILGWSDIPREGKKHETWATTTSATATGKFGSIESILFTPDGSSLLVGYSEGLFEVWDVASKSCTQQSDVFSGKFRCFSHSQQLCVNGDTRVEDMVLVGTDRSIHVYSSPNLSFVGEYGLSSNPISVCTIRNVDGRLFFLVGCQDGLVTAFDGSNDATTSGARTQSQDTPKSKLGCVTIVALALERSSVLCGHYSGAVSIWCLKTGKLTCVSGHKHKKEVSCIDVSDDQYLAVSGSYDGSLRVWDLVSRTSKLMLPGHERRVVTVNMSSDNTRIVSLSFRSCWLSEVRVWDATSGSPTLCAIATRIFAARNCVCLGISQESNLCYCAGVTSDGDNISGLVINLKDGQVLSKVEKNAPDSFRRRERLGKEEMDSMMQLLLPSVSLSTPRLRHDVRTRRYHSEECETPWHANRMLGGMEFRYSPLKSGCIPGTSEAWVTIRTRKKIISAVLPCDPGCRTPVSNSSVIACVLEDAMMPFVLEYVPRSGGRR